MGAEVGGAAQISVHTRCEIGLITIRTSDPVAFKLPLTAKSVAVLFVFLPLVEFKANVVGGRIKIRLSGFVGTESTWTCLGDGRIAGRIAKPREPTRSFFSLNRADLLSWVDMGKTGTGFPGICQTFIIQRIQCPSSHSLFCSPLHRINFTHPYKYNVHPPESDPIVKSGWKTIRGVEKMIHRVFPVTPYGVRRNECLELTEPGVEVQKVI